MDAIRAPAGPSPERTALRSALALGAVLALGALAYANALHGAFVFDDIEHVRDNPLLRDLGNFLGGLRAYRATPNRWVGYLTFALNHRLGGTDVVGYHLFNVGVHLANGALVYALVALAFRTRRLGASALAQSWRAVAFAASALFVAHPIQTQAVSYVVQRFTSLATFFYLASVVAYLAWRLRREEGSRGTALYVASLVAAVLAMRTKEIAATLPLAVLLVEVSFFDRAGRSWLLVVPYFAFPFLIVATLVHGGGSVGAVVSGADQATRVQTDLGRLAYLFTELAVVVTYLQLLLLPVGQNVDHDYPIHRSLLEPDVLSAVAVLLALAGLAVFLHRRTSSRTAGALDPALRLVAFGIAWFFLALSVESSVIPIVDVINEHRVYLPSVGFFVAIAVGIVLLARRLSPTRAPQAAVGAALVLALALAAATRARNEVWANPVALWADSAARSPDKPRPVLNLGTALVEAGRPREALAPLRRAAELDPASAWARVQLGGVLLALGRPADAEHELREAVRLRDDDPEALFDLAMLLARSGRATEAKPLFRRFLEVAPASYAQARGLAAARVAGP